MTLQHKRFAVPPAPGSSRGLRELASQTDPHAFQLLYHDPRVHTAEIATRFGVQQSRLSELAHLLGIPTRREAGVCYKPTLLRASKPKREKLGPCNPECPEWQRCTSQRLGVTGPLPCEKMLGWEIENEFEEDSLPSLWTIPLVVRVAVEAMG